jgi:hypothetical protein
MLPASMLKAPVCPTPIGCFTDNVEERFFILLIPPAITPIRAGAECAKRDTRLMVLSRRVAAAGPADGTQTRSD